MGPGSSRRIDPWSALAAVVAAGAIAWLAPLMLDQFVLFADQEQSARAAASRHAIWLPAALLVGAAGLAALRRGVVHGAAVGSPLVAVALAWTAPAAAYELLAFALSLPVAVAGIGALLVRLPARVPPVALGLAIVLLVVVAVAATAWLAFLAALGGVTWWLLSRAAERPGRDAG